MSIGLDDSETFRREFESFHIQSGRQRIEFTLKDWYVTMYRITGQHNLVRVDFKKREIEGPIRLKAYGPKVLHPEHEGEIIA